jgi:signal transduction histidine kinase
VHGALAEMRTLLFELRPEALRAAPVDTLLERLGTALSGQIQVPVEVSVREDTALPEEVKVTLYRVAQEALSNVGKYARATRVSVMLVADDDGATLAVEDDGRGFDPACVALECMGMRIMGERLRQIGGTIAIESEAGRGTSVVARWPRPAQGVSARLEEVSDEQSGAHPGDDRR